MSSNNNYYEFKDAKVAIAMELGKRGWKLYGFHEDESDWMTDYWSPAWWEGIATKDGFVVVVDCRWNDKSGKEIIQHIYNSEEVILSAKTRSLIERLSEVRQDRGASAAEEQTANAKIEKLRAKANNQTEKIKVTDHYPEYQPNPPRMSWHVEKDGVIIAKGNGVAKFSDMKYFDKEGYEKDLKECDKDSYRYERAEKLLKLAKQFEGGILWQLRLSVDDYHRYIYPVSGRRSHERTINGVFHTVQPIALEHCPVYKENTRKYCIIKTKEFGTILMMEVGAMMVGRITNHEAEPGYVTRGEEKGYFEFGGSTVILAFAKDMVKIKDEIIKNSAEDFETIVKMGDVIGEKF